MYERERDVYERERVTCTRESDMYERETCTRESE